MTRYTPQFKANLIKKFRSLDDAGKLDVLRDHHLSPKEFAEWMLAYDANGVRGLRVTLKNPKTVGYEAK